MALLFSKKYSLSILAATTLMTSNLYSGKSALKTTLFHAAENGDFNTVKRIIKARPKLIRSRYYEPGRLLHFASAAGHINVVAYLIQQGARVNARGTYQTTALHEAAAHGHRHVACYLLEHNAQIDAQESTGYTPLHKAANNGHANVVECLIEKGAQVNSRTTHADTPLHYAIIEGECRVGQLLIENGALVNAQDDSQSTPLHNISQKGIILTEQCCINLAKSLLKKGADIDAEDNDHVTPLSLAAHREEPLTIHEFLLVLCLLEHYAYVGPKELHLLQEHYPILFIEPSIFKQRQNNLLEALHKAGLPQDLEKLLSEFIVIDKNLLETS